MAWNQPDNNGQDRGLWGSGKPGGNSEGNRNKDGRDQRPPGLDDAFYKLSKKLGGLGGGKGTGSGGGSSLQGLRPQLGDRVVTITAAAIATIWTVSGFYIIRETERDMVTRFGKFSHLIEPGSNWKPTFIDEIKPMDAEAVRELVASGVMLASDENVARAETDVQHRVTDPEKHLYSVTSPDDSLRQATDSALREVIGKYTMDRILAEDHTVIRSDTQYKLEETIRPYDMGITLLDVSFQTAHPPEEAKAAFDNVVVARESEQQYTREAEAYTNKVQPRVNGQAQCILEKACVYKTQIILEAQGEVVRFIRLLPEYKAASEITHERLYTETMEKVLGNTRKVPASGKGGNLMVLLLDQVPKSGNAPAAESDNGANNLLRLSPASSSTINGASNASSTSQGDIMDQRRANVQHSDYQHRGE